MIIDKIENLDRYGIFQRYQKEICKFIEWVETEPCAEGKYEIAGDKLYALLQKYDTKSKQDGVLESHIKYADLQYIVSGEEVIFYDCREELHILEDKREESDIVFYKTCADKGGILLQTGMFGYFGPQDAHMPCISSDKGKSQVVKIVFKIQI